MSCARCCRSTRSSPGTADTDPGMPSSAGITPVTVNLQGLAGSADEIRCGSLPKVTAQHCRGQCRAADGWALIHALNPRSNGRPRMLSTTIQQRADQSAAATASCLATELISKVVAEHGVRASSPSPARIGPVLDTKCCVKPSGDQPTCCQAYAEMMRSEHVTRTRRAKGRGSVSSTLYSVYI